MKALLLKAGKQLLAQLTSGDKEKRRNVMIAIVGITFSLFLIPILFLTLPGILAKSILINLSGGDDAEDYEIYQDVQSAYDRYIEEKYQEAEEEVRALQERYSYEEEYPIYIWDEKTQQYIPTGETGIETIYPDVQKTVEIERPEVRLLMAYVSTKQFYNDRYKVNEYDAFAFLNVVMVDESTYQGWNPIYYEFRYQVLDVDTVAQLFFDKDQREQFLTIYDNLLEVEGEYDDSWTEDGILDVANVTEARRNLLDIAYAQRGSPYALGAKGEILTVNLINRLKLNFGQYRAQYDRIPQRYYDGQTRTFDCTGFVYYVYKKAGYEIQYYATNYWISSQGGKYWKCISYSELQPGDVLAWNDGSQGHAMIYLSGKGSNLSNYQVIHAPMFGSVVKVSGYGRHTAASNTIPSLNGHVYAFRYIGF